jgi:hypothetical protein
MSLLGTRAWWLPAWIARRMPRVALEHQHPASSATGREEAASDMSHGHIKERR